MKLPEPQNEAPRTFVEAARAALGDELRAIVLYGSAAEGRLRATSDVNVIVVLRSFEASGVDALREPLRRSFALARVTPMFLLESEVNAAVTAFTVKFADVLRRRQVLFGSDPFEGVRVPRDAEIARLKPGAAEPRRCRPAPTATNQPKARRPRCSKRISPASTWTWTNGRDSSASHTLEHGRRA